MNIQVKTGVIPLSAVILTHNSAKKLSDCLESVKGWVDDIVVVDDCSTDESLAIAKRYTDHIIQRKWDLEGVHRNFAYSQAKHAYILSLDSDERVTPGLREELIKLITEGPTHNAYNIGHRNFIGNYWIRHGGWYPNQKLKLMKKSAFRYEESEYHPRAFVEGENPILKGELIHLAYDDFSNLFAKINHQTNFEAKKWVRDKRKMSLGLCCWKAFHRFFKAYILKQGFREGVLGFVMAFAGGYYQMITYAKYWELKNSNKNQ